jgi:hypothetical protein
MCLTERLLVISQAQGLILSYPGRTNIIRGWGASTRATRARTVTESELSDENRSLVCLRIRLDSLAAVLHPDVVDCRFNARGGLEPGPLRHLWPAIYVPISGTVLRLNRSSCFQDSEYSTI